MCRQYRHQGHCKNDADSVASVIYYLENEPEFIVRHDNLTSFDDESPLVIFQSRKTILQSPPRILGLDATFNVSCYKNVCIFAIVGRSNGGAIPLGYLVPSSQTCYNLFYRVQNSVCIQREVDPRSPL